MASHASERNAPVSEGALVATTAAATAVHSAATLRLPNTDTGSCATPWPAISASPRRCSRPNADVTSSRTVNARPVATMSLAAPSRMATNNAAQWAMRNRASQPWNDGRSPVSASQATAAATSSTPANVCSQRSPTMARGRTRASAVPASTSSNPRRACSASSQNGSSGRTSSTRNTHVTTPGTAVLAGSAGAFMRSCRLRTAGSRRRRRRWRTARGPRCPRRRRGI